MSPIHSEPTYTNHWTRPIYLATGKGWLYLCAVRDGCSRRVIGDAFSGFRYTGIGGTVLRRAVTFCDTGTAGVVSHADRGSRYTLTRLADVAEGLAVLLSAGRTGVCWDNARNESFWPTPKTEFHDLHEFATHAQAIQAVNSCTETVYNHRRPYNTLGQTPSNPRTPNHHRSQPDRSTDIHQTGSTPRFRFEVSVPFAGVELGVQEGTGSGDVVLLFAEEAEGIAPV